MFCCEFCEISKNTFLTEHLRGPASEKDKRCHSGAKKTFIRTTETLPSILVRKRLIFVGFNFCGLIRYIKANSFKPSLQVFLRKLYSNKNYDDLGGLLWKPLRTPQVTTFDERLSFWIMKRLTMTCYALNGKRIWENGLTSFPLKSTRIKFTSIDDFRRKRNQLIRW